MIPKLMGSGVEFSNFFQQGTTYSHDLPDSQVYHALIKKAQGSFAEPSGIGAI